ncbi:MAG TPA: hypothetical protein PK156_27815 [Polyangium sp.]|nr:hypothetical protein [Polyangium sp.]
MTKRIGVLGSTCFCVLALTNLGHAQPKQPSAAAKDTARTLLLDCRDKFGKKDFEGALKSCQGAHSIMGVPTTGLDLAKVQQAMGLLVECRETALEAVRFDNSANNAAFAQAQTEANKIAQDLEKRLPALVLSVSGLPANATAKVVVDADEVPAAAMSLPYRVNPGTHTIVASAKDFKDRKKTVTVTEGQTITLDLLMSQGPDEDEGPPSPGRKIPVWAWIAGGVGVVGGVGAVYFGMQFGETKTKVDRDCPNNQCNSDYTPEQAQALQSKWNQQLGLTVVASVVGAAGLGAAIYGIVTAPKKTEAPVSARVTPWIGPGTSGVFVTGSF